MTEHNSRRNSLTSMSTTASSQNNISVHDLSTDNLIAVDSKFVKKPTKKFPNSNGISPKLLSDTSFVVLLVAVVPFILKKEYIISLMVKYSDQEQHQQKK